MELNDNGDTGMNPLGLPTECDPAIVHGCSAELQVNTFWRRRLAQCFGPTIPGRMLDASILCTMWSSAGRIAN